MITLVSADSTLILFIFHSTGLTPQITDHRFHSTAPWPCMRAGGSELAGGPREHRSRKKTVPEGRCDADERRGHEGRVAPCGRGDSPARRSRGASPRLLLRLRLLQLPLSLRLRPRLPLRLQLQLPLLMPLLLGYRCGCCCRCRHRCHFRCCCCAATVIAAAAGPGAAAIDAAVTGATTSVADSFQSVLSLEYLKQGNSLFNIKQRINNVYG